MKSDVYYIRLKNKGLQERISCLERLLTATGSFEFCKKDEIVPVKITIGDSRCVYHVSPELVKTVIGMLKNKGTRPFLFDTNVIYKGGRQNAVDHMTLANNKGFGQSKVGAPFIVADGLFGRDGKEYDIRSGNIDKVRMPSFIGMVESLVVLSHVTGHILSGYAGAIKNVAMGMSCKPTKQVQHSSVRPQITEGKCTACGCCIQICPAAAISLKNKKAFVNQEACLGCGECLCACKFDAIAVNWKEEVSIFCKRMVDVACVILPKFKNKMFINFAFDVTKECDCISAKGEKVVCADLGILASTDIVSLDKATVDLINKEGDIFLKEQGTSEYYRMFEYAREKGLGLTDYNLKIIE